MNIKSLTPTPHIKALSTQIAKIVIMPGDPLRAKYIATTFLESGWIQVNDIRNMLMFTGKYKDCNVTIAASGMGMGSIGIYSYELYKFYDVDCIIRVGSAGSYQEQIKIYDIINVSKAYSESSFAKHAFNIDEKEISAVGIISAIINQVAQKNDQQLDNNPSKLVKKINLKSGVIHSSDVFYSAKQDKTIAQKCLAVEMESFALFANAQFLKKNAACLLTISDSFVTGESISATLRETSFEKMILLALEAVVAYYDKESIDDNLSHWD